MNQLKALFLFILLACSLNITAQRIKGSDTVLPVSQETAEIFMKDDPDRRSSVDQLLCRRSDPRRKAASLRDGLDA